MFRLALILFGGDALVKRWKIFMVAGVLTALFGILLLVDLVDGVADVATWVLGAVLLAQGVVELVVGATHARERRRFEMLRGAAMVVFACLVLDFPWDNSIAAGILFGAAITFNGLVRIASSWLIRYPSWRKSNLIGWAYLVLALLLLTNWPVPSSMNVSLCTGLALIAGGHILMRGAWRLRRLPRGSRLAAVELYSGTRVLQPDAAPATAEALAANAAAGHMIVHVWTAVDAVDDDKDRIRLPLIERYIASMTKKGRVSTGHVALECEDGLYISHHPRVRLAITQANLVGHLRATSGNDHPGVWLPCYAEEAAATRPSTHKLHFRIYNRSYLQAFWDVYRQDDTYNLTHRNCSVVVTQAVDAAMEGVFADKPFWRTLLRLALHPDVWMAGSARVRAESMAWTPGLALDYVSAIRRITHPRHDLKVHLSRWWKTRKARRLRVD